MQNKAFSTIGILIILIILIGGGYFGWQYFGEQEEGVKTNEIADWNTYESEKYGFAINYPKNWHAFNVGDVLFAASEEIFSEAPQLPMISFTDTSLKEIKEDSDLNIHEIRIEIKENFSSIDEWLKDWEDNKERWKELGIEVNVEEIDVGKEKGYKVTDIISMETAEFITSRIGLSKGQKVYEIRQISPNECSGGECKIFNQMLSTFRFLD